MAGQGAAIDDEPSITVFHLVWAPFGPDRFARFLDSYRAHPPGAAHRLHVLFNGFGSPAEVAPYEAIIADIPHDSTVLDRPVQDIQAYLDAARAARTRYLCYLNSYAEILADDWLGKLYRNIRGKSVGVVGATGSCESRSDETIRDHRFTPFHLGLNVLQWPRRFALQRAARARERAALRLVKDRFPAFPNPHLRTNAFLLERTTMLAAEFGPIECKEDAYQFESGRLGLTYKVLNSGREALVVGRDGRGYPVAEWGSSRTFRSGEQPNLLVADNQTRIYAEAPPATRAELVRDSWGEGRSTEPPPGRQ